ncbi:MAG: outer membrane beta-barrel protein [Saprospiraceae bacterium]|nr:outer membrane beta-barrel protein [Saprospiraceae bacterium]
MKKTFTLLALLFSASISFAQTTKGSIFLGASTNLTGGFGDFSHLFGILPANQLAIGFGKSTKTFEFKDDIHITKWNSVNVQPMAGYFVADGFMIGAGIGFLTHGYKEETNADEFRTYIFSAAPMVRYYLKQSGKLRPYLEVRGGFMSVSTNKDLELLYLETPYSATLYGGKLGGAIFIGDRTSLDLFADFTGTFRRDEFVEFSKTTTSSFGIGAGLSYFLK